MKKSLSIPVCFIMMAAMVLGGCTSSTPTAPAETTSTATATSAPVVTAESNMTDPGQLPIVKEKVTLKIVFQTRPSVGDLTTNAQTKWVEDQTNIHINWEQITGEDAAQKVSLKLASNDLPDVFFSCWLTQKQELQYGVKEKVLVPLNGYIDKYGFWINQKYNQFPELKSAITSPDGNIYSLCECIGSSPDTGEVMHALYGNKYWINQKWLDKLGLPMPKTTDEFYQTMVAFRDNDPNGNGKKDELPIIATSWSNPISFLISSFIYDDGSPDSWPRAYRMQVVDGKVSSILNQPQFREGLRYLNKLYKDGLFYEASFTQNSEQAQKLTTSDPEIVGGYQMMAPFWITPTSSTLYKDLVVMPSLKGPEGAQYAGYYGTQPDTGMFSITTACKTPEIAFRFADFCYSDEFFMRSLNGPKGEYWRDANPDEKNYLGQPATWAIIRPILDPGAQTQNVAWGKGLFLGTVQNFLTNKAAVQPFDLFADSSQEELIHEATKVYIGYQPKQTLPPVMRFMTEEADKLATIETELNKYVREAELQFITGDLSLDKNWDAYVASLKKLGLDDRNTIYQTAYDRMNKK